MTTTVFCDESGSHHPKRPGTWLIGGYRLDHPSPSEFTRELLKEIVEFLNSSDWFPDLRQKAKAKRRSNRRIAEDCTELLHVGFGVRNVHYRDISIAVHELGCDPTHVRGLAELDRLILKIADNNGMKLLISIHDGSRIESDGMNYSAQCVEFLGWVVTHLVHDHPDARRDRIQFVLAHKGVFQDALEHLSPTLLAQAVEAGLVSTGTLSLLDRSKPLIAVTPMDDGALRFADLICGVAKHHVIGVSGLRRKREVLEKLGYSVTLSLRDVERRRAFVAAREGRLADAAVLTIESGQGRRVLRPVIRRLLSQHRSQAARYGIDQIIEGIDVWSRHADKQEVSARCEDLVSCLHDLRADLSTTMGSEFDAIEFRVRSYALVWANHLGDLNAAERHRNTLARLKDGLVFDVQLMEPVSLFEIGVVESLINAHEFEAAATEATKHVLRLAGLSGVPSDELAQGMRYHGSNHTLRRAFTAYRRALLLFASDVLLQTGGKDKEALRTVRNAVDDVRSVLGEPVGMGHTSLSDRIRLIQLLGFGFELLATYDPESPEGADGLKTLLMQTEGLEEMAADPFGAAVLLRDAGTLCLLGRSLRLPASCAGALRGVLAGSSAELAVRHPGEIILREGLLSIGVLGFEPEELERVRREAIARLEEWRRLPRVSAAVFAHQRGVCDAALSRASRKSRGPSLPNGPNQAGRGSSAGTTASVTVEDLLRMRARSIY